MPISRAICGGTELLDSISILKKIDLSPGMKVADLGCGGSGHFSFQVARIVGDEGVVYAVDILKSVLRTIEVKAKLEGINNIKTVWSNLEVLGAAKIEDGFLDVALLVNILFQSKKHQEIFKETARVLKRGGKLLVIDWKPTGGAFGPPIQNRVKKDSLRMIATGEGFRVREEFEAGQYHFGIIFEKE